MTAIIATTERLIVRHFVPKDVDDLLGLVSDPIVMRFSVRGPWSRERTEQFISFCMKGYEEQHFDVYGVTMADSDHVIGLCGYFVQQLDGKKEYELGYRLRREYWGQGLATEATRAIRDHGFRDLGFVRIISMIESENFASIRVAEKNSMLYERDSISNNIPVRIYAISRGRWEMLRQE